MQRTKAKISESGEKLQSVIRFLHSTYLRIFRLNDVTYLSTRAVYITMVTRNRRSCNLSGSSLTIGVYTTNKKWKNALF